MVIDSDFYFYKYYFSPILSYNKVQNVVAYFGDAQHEANNIKNGECNENDSNETTTEV